MRILFSSFFLGLLILSACARDISSGTYSEAGVGESSKTYEGTIVAERMVKVKKEKLTDNSTGMLVGGGTGALAGNAFGKGNGNLATTIGGGLLGAIAGTYAEDALTSQDAMEYIVKLKGAGEIRKKRKVNGGNVSGEGSDMVKEGESNIKTIVQAPDVSLHVGSPVYVIESGKNRSRIIPR